MFYTSIFKIAVFFQHEGWFTCPILYSDRLLAFSLSSLKVLALASHLIFPIYEFWGRSTVFFPSIILSNIILYNYFSNSEYDQPFSNACSNRIYERMFSFHSSKYLFVCFSLYLTYPFHTHPKLHLKGSQFFLFSIILPITHIHMYFVTLFIF